MPLLNRFLVLVSFFVMVSVVVMADKQLDQEVTSQPPLWGEQTSFFQRLVQKGVPRLEMNALWQLVLLRECLFHILIFS